MSFDDIRYVDPDEECPTVSKLVSDEHMVARRIAALTEQRFVAARLLPSPPPLTWRRRLSARVWRLREALAYRLAPWLERS